jgi:hypothetical protein
MNPRLHFIVEGQTEETFVNRVLVPHFASFSIWADVRKVMTSKQGNYYYRGGIRQYDKVKKDISLWIKEDHKADSFFTTMIDLYALPSDFPEYATLQALMNHSTKVINLENAFSKDIDHPHFIPYIQLHEFESLVLVDPLRLKTQFDGRDKNIDRLSTECAKSKTPEDINEGQDTAPSKRIIREVPEYEGRKSSVGPIITEKIGLPILRTKCEHFNNWLTRLEKICV